MRTIWTFPIAAVAASAVMCAPPASGRTLAGSMSVTGDSISRGFDADTSTCTYADQVPNNWASGDDASALCTAGPNGILSEAERLECVQGSAITIFNDSMSGGTMVDDFANQAASAMTNLFAAPAPRYVAVLMGHNDACTSEVAKTGNTCSGDHDPDNYCRTTNVAFERELRRGLDQLIQIPNARIQVMATVRVSELCSVSPKQVCGAGSLFVSCGNLWASGPTAICKSLTADCSPQRQIDMYNTLVGYNTILQKVTGQYNRLRKGHMSPTGAVKAADVRLKFTRGTFYGKFIDEDVSCCDCFHPSLLGQAKLTEVAWSGVHCSKTNPCCGHSTDPYDLARCGVPNTKAIYPGGFWPRALRGLVPPAP